MNTTNSHFENNPLISPDSLPIESPINDNFSPAGKVIFQDIKKQIIQGDLLPGDRLPSERKLMELYGRSRPTVREALRMLDRAGFIKILPHRRPIVLEYTGSGIEKPINEAIEVNLITLSEIKEFRSVVESATAAWAAERRTNEDVRNLHNCILQMKQSVTDYETFLALDVSFHTLVARASKNRTCEIILSSISDISRNYTRSDLEKRSARKRKLRCLEIYELHRIIFEKIRVKDPEGAKEAMLYHLKVFEDTVDGNPISPKNS